MKNLFIFAGLCFLVAGCSIFPKPQTLKVNYFSIGVPDEQMIEKRRVEVQMVNTLTANTTAMRFKSDTGKIEIDQFNRWINLPSTQIQRYLTAAMTTKTSIGDKQTALIMTIKLLTFDGDLSHKTANLTLLVTVKEHSKVKYEQLFIEKVDVTGTTATAYANAMTRAINKIAVNIAMKINNLK